MIVKVLARHSPSYGSIIDYLTKEGKGKQGKPIIITHNFKGSSKEELVKEFMENESFRRYMRKDQIYMYHEIISLSNKEKSELITEELLRDLTEQYINLRGKDGMYIAAFHEDKDHAHIHFAVSGVKYRTGKAHRLSQKDLHELKVKFQEYHKGQYPFLSFSNPEHGKGIEYEKHGEYFNKGKRTNVKESIREKIHTLFNESKSQHEFIQKLQENDLHFYERNGKPTGIVFNDLKFRFSRLDISLDEKPVDIEIQTEEQKALEDILALRESRFEKDREIERE